MRDVILSFLAFIVCISCFFLGYGIGIKDPEPKEARELEKQIKHEELKKLQLENQMKIMELGIEEKEE